MSIDVDKFMEQLRQLQEANEKEEAERRYLAPYPQNPCPSCGHCPTCGRNAAPRQPWLYDTNTYPFYK